MNWGNLLAHAANTFYTEFILQLVALLVIITYFLKKDKTKDLRYLIVLTIASLIECLISDFDFLTSETIIKGKMGGLILLVYVVIEFICCLLFIRANILSNLVKKIILFSPIAFITYYGIRLANRYKKPLSKPVIHVSALDIQGLVVIFFCLYFFYELLVDNSNKSRYTKSAAWAISGILVLFSTIAPLSLFISYLLSKDPPLMHNLWAINNIAYSIMFITFIMAIRSNKTAAESNN